MTQPSSTISDRMEMGAKKCLVCYSQTGKVRNDTLYWHSDPEAKGYGLGIWTWCNRCERAYSIEEYTAKCNLSLSEFLKQEFYFKEVAPDEVRKIEWPQSFIPLHDKRAAEGVAYLKSRGVDLDDNLFYDTWRKGIVFPYYFDSVFVGAQIRLIEPWKDEEDGERKIDTLPGTRVGLLFYNWNQRPFNTPIRGVIVTEGAFNTLVIQQALNKVYGGPIRNPWKCVALSGSGVSKHHIDSLKELKDQGVKIVVAPDNDEAGFKMLKKFVEAKVATHFALTGDSKKDWNDISQTMDKVQFAKWFIGNIKNV